MVQLSAPCDLTTPLLQMALGDSVALGVAEGQQVPLIGGPAHLGHGVLVTPQCFPQRRGITGIEFGTFMPEVIMENQSSKRSFTWRYAIATQGRERSPPRSA